MFFRVYEKIPDSMAKTASVSAEQSNTLQRIAEPSQMRALFILPLLVSTALAQRPTPVMEYASVLTGLKIRHKTGVIEFENCQPRVGQRVPSSEHARDCDALSGKARRNASDTTDVCNLATRWSLQPSFTSRSTQPIRSEGARRIHRHVFCWQTVNDVRRLHCGSREKR